MFHFTSQERLVIIFLTFVILLGNSLQLIEKKKPSLMNLVKVNDLNQFRRKIDLNQASAADLEGLPYIGPTSARRIIAFRQAKGKFHSVQELEQVVGIGPGLLNKIRNLVYIKE